MNDVRGPVAVTGAAGFLGRHLLRTLRRQGLGPVRALARRVPPELPGDLARPADGADAITWIEGDLESESVDAALDRLLAGTGTLFHLAGLYLEGEAHAERLERVNVLGTERVLRAAQRAGTPRILHCSTMGTCAPRADGRPATEADEVAEGAGVSAYVRTKIRGERIARSWEANEVVIANPAAPIGADDRGPSVTGRRVAAVLAGRRPPLPLGEVAYAPAEGIAEGFLALAARGRAGQRYLLGGENLGPEAFLARVAAAGGVRVPRERWWKRFTRRGGGGAPANLAVDDSLARDELGWEPGDLDRALAEAASDLRPRG